MRDGSTKMSQSASSENGSTPARRSSPDVEREHAIRMAEVAKVLGDPIPPLVEWLRKHAGRRSASASRYR